ncbi:CHAT domain-containing protein [Flammula alnicola]|nr:CHAT domain-containing protein [Flammula alnicola]
MPKNKRNRNHSSHQHHHRHSVEYDLDDPIAQIRLSIESSKWETATLLRELGSHLRDRFSQSKELCDIDEAVEVHRQSLIIFQDHPHHNSRPSFLSHYGFVLHDRFHHTHKVDDINNAISQHQTALDLSYGTSNEFDILINLAKSLRCRFDAVRDKADLDRGISHMHRAMTLRPQDGTALNILAGCLERRVEAVYQEDDNAQLNMDVKEFVEVQERNLKEASSTKSEPGELQNEIGTSFFELFHKTLIGQLLNKAISIFCEARTIPGLSPRYELNILSNLSACFMARYRQKELRQPSDLENAAELSHRCHQYPGSIPSKVRVFIVTTRCNVLQTQYDESGEISKLNEAIALSHQYLGSPEGAVIPEDDRVSLLLVLGMALRDRFLESGRTNTKDLDDSVKFLQEARNIAPTDAVRMRATHALVGTLILHHHAQGLPGNPATLRTVIQLQEEVVNATLPTDFNRPTVLSILGMAWEELYLVTRTLKDLDEGIKYSRDAIKLSASPNQKTTYLSNIVYSLHRRYIHNHHLEDLDEAIAKCQEAISYIEEPHPDLCIIQSSLGRVLTDKFTRTKNRECLQAATDAFRTAALNNTASITQRFFAAQRWAAVADEHNHETAMEAYTSAVQFLPRMAVLGLDLTARQQMLTAGTDGLAREAAKCAINSGLFDRAIEFLEQGRAVFWSQALQLRTPLDELMDSPAPGPALAEKLQKISKTLEQRSRNVAKREAGQFSHEDQFVTEKHAAELRNLDDQWQACVEEVRLLPRFEKFLLPRSYSDLQVVSSHGPVVILNIAGGSADALILRAPSEKIVHVPLPKFTPQAIQTFGGFWGIVRGSADYTHRSRGVATSSGPDSVLGRGLGVLWRTVVKPVIRALDLKKSELPDRIWWCPTGQFVSLPIHAAGIYSGPGQECLADYAVSSYIPTLATLLPVASEPAPQVPNLKMLAVIQPETNLKGWGTLESTRDELKNIQQVVPSDSLASYGLEGAPATVDTILRQIPTANIVHFACHGKQDATDPLESALVLEDGLLKVPQIMELSLTAGSLVFLSACQTATGDKGLPDELMHLAATMLFAGFTGAVGTMWSIRDEDGPIVADSFYRHLFSQSPSSGSPQHTNPQTAEAARALHAAVAKLRQQGRPFMSWVPFIHLGY